MRSADEIEQPGGPQAVADQRELVVGRGDEREAHRREGEAVSAGLAALLAAGTPVGDPAVRDLVARHHAWVALFWTPDAEAYRNLAAMYVDDPRFAATYDAVAAGLAVYLRDAVEAHADAVAGG